MSVTQDYKILTLTAAEYDAVRSALAMHELELNTYIAHESCEKVRFGLQIMLTRAQTALAKVRA